MNLRWSGDGDWALARPRATVRRGRSASKPRSAPIRPELPSALDAELRRAGVEIALGEVVTPATRRGGERSALDFVVEGAPGEQALVLIQHPSGATTFHAPVSQGTARRGRALAAPSWRFRIELAPEAPVRRGLIDAGIKLLVAKVRQKLIDAAVRAGLHAAALGAETLWWRQRKLAEGWHRIVPTPKGIRLASAQPREVSGERSLLFLHGTFSDTVGSFGSLLQPQVLAELRQRYQDRLFGFEHFTVSRSPGDNVRRMLEFLPDREQLFDVVAYSRGGLVLRTLAEQAESLGSLGRRFRLGQGVLVAVPNGGTPLATGRRWEQTFGLLSTLLELVPDGPLTPLTTAAGFIADGLVWLAGHLSGDLPGLHAMDADGPTIGALQRRGTDSPRYSAIGANHQPTEAIWQKLLDTGVDGFFAGANDLVVPSDGALAVDPGSPRVIPADRVCCFGPGGNLRANAGGVHHLNILGQEETAAFVLQALRGEGHRLPAIDLDRVLPSRRLWRGGAPMVTGPAGSRPAVAAPRARRDGRAPERPEPAVQESDVSYGLASPVSLEGDRTLQIMIIGDPDAPQDGAKRRNYAQVVASYGNARVVELFRTHDVDGMKDAGTRFKKIIQIDERIEMNLDGRVSATTGRVPELPSDDELCDFGGLLFEALFTPRVRRLYDLARSEQRGSPLNVVFTCTIPWITAKPWEFLYDPSRHKFLATEEIHFIRNVMTAVPAQRVAEGRERLHILVVEAQPAGTAELAVDEEEQQIRFRFQPLIATGLVEIDVLVQATPGRLHERLVQRNLEGRPYDVVHFIGHGDYDSEASQGRLLFHTESGGSQMVETQTLRELLCNRGIQLVFLNACDTARGDRKRTNRGVAPALVEGGLPAVVANQYKVLDPSAVAFAQHFYWSLANGATLGEAAREARIAVNYSIDGEIIDWAVPVLYARDPDRQLCLRKLATVPLRPAPLPVTAARTERSRAHRAGTGSAPEFRVVGIADLGRFFVGLGDIVDRLNAVQDRFVFRLVEVNTPLGVWERDPVDNIDVLDAKRFAKKLEDRPRALGVDLLGCITNWWMGDDEIVNLYQWWPNSQDGPRVFTISTAGLEVPARGPEAGRVVANSLVAAMGGYFIDALTKYSIIHSNPPKDCPYFENRDRDHRFISGRLRISPQSRALLMKHLPRNLDPRATVRSFDAMLAAYERELSRGDRARAPGTRRRAKATAPR